MKHKLILSALILALCPVSQSHAVDVSVQDIGLQAAGGAIGYLIGRNSGENAGVLGTARSEERRVGKEC